MSKPAKTYSAGIDLGSTITKVVIIDEKAKVLAAVKSVSGAEHRRRAGEVMALALKKANLSLKDINAIAATGYGRINVPFADCQITELTCHAAGVVHLFPNARTAIDIGGQDAKGMKILNNELSDFIMNERCAAGTGRYLEVAAETLGIKLEEMAKISQDAKKPAKIGSTCALFARQDIIALISAGTPLPEILAGLHEAVATRTVKMLRVIGIEPDVVFTGGVALNTAVAEAIRRQLGCPMMVPKEPLFTGALGAALLAPEEELKAMARGETTSNKKRQLGIPESKEEGRI